MTDKSGFDATRTSQVHSRLLRMGDVLADRYRIEDVIGVGAMGTVYRAHDTRLDLTVALKILHVSIAQDNQTITRFETELKLARQVSHPNVVRIHDIGEHETLSFLSMDLIPGRPLDEIIDGEGKLDPDRVAKIGAGIARGLRAAHAKQVVHRDLKPANILVDDNDNAVITDFGVARSAASARLTKTGYFVGTPDYLAPEQARGDDTDGRTDIYALGLILYEMLHGQVPFHGQSMEELVAQRTLGKQPKLTRANFAGPQYLRDVIKKCLQKSPEDRYRSARQLARDLEAHASPSTNLNRLSKWALAIAAVFIAGLLIRPFLTRDPANELPVSTDIAINTPLSIAILPFHQQPPDPALRWVANAAYDSLAIELAAVSTLNVVDKQRVTDTLSDLHINTGAPTPQIADQLLSLFGADWLITATLINTNGHIVVRTDMIPSSAMNADASFVETKVDLSKVNGIGEHIAPVIRETLSLPASDFEPARLSSNMDALRAYSTGVEALLEGNSIEAIPSLESALDIDDSFAAAWLQLANAYEQSGRVNDAALAIQRAIETSGNDQSVVSLARVKQAELTGDFELAINVLEQKLQSRPSDTTTQLLLAELKGDQGQYEPALNMLQNIVASDSNHPLAWYLLGKFSIQNGDSQSALNTYLPKALKIQERLNNPQGQGNVLNAMGIAHHRVGKFEEAGESYAKSAEMRASIEDFRGLGSSLGNLARLELQLGKFESARASLDRAIEVRSKIQDLHGLADLYNIYGVLEEEVGDYRKALERYRQALKIREDRDDQFSLGISYNNMGFSYFMLGEYDNANLYLGQAIEQSRETSNPDIEMQAQQGLGQLRLAQGKWNEASQLFLQSLETSRKLGFPDAEAVALGNLARVAYHTGRFNAALDSYSDSLKILEELNDSRGLIEYSIWRAETWLHVGALENAAKDIGRALDLLSEHKRNEQLVYAHSINGALLESSGNSSGAARSFSQAFEAASQTGNDTPAVYLAITQRTYQDTPPTDVIELVDTARSVGNASLYMQAMLIKARAEFDTENLESSTATMSELLLFLKTHSPYFDAWKIHALAKRIFEANGDTALTAREQQALTRETGRMLADASPDIRKTLLRLFNEAGALVE